MQKEGPAHITQFLRFAQIAPNLFAFPTCGLRIFKTAVIKQQWEVLTKTAGCPCSSRSLSCKCPASSSHCSETACDYGRGMLDFDAEHPPDSFSLRGVVALLSSKGLGSVFLSSLGITRNGDALTALRRLLFLRRSEGHLCAVLWDACQSWKSRKQFLKMPKRGCMAPCSNGRPHGPNKHFNFSSKALCGMLEGFTCIYRGCSLYPHARDYRLFPRKTPS